MYIYILYGSDQISAMHPPPSSKLLRKKKKKKEKKCVIYFLHVCTVYFEEDILNQNR